MVLPVGFWKAVCFEGKKGLVDGLIEFVDSYCTCGSRRYCVLSNKVVGTARMTYERDDLSKKSFIKAAMKVIKIISYIPFGLPALLVKCILRNSRKFVYESSIAGQGSDRPAPSSPKYSAETFRYNQTVFLTIAELAVYKIVEGKSGLQEFADSRFQYTQVHMKGGYDVRRFILPYTAETFEFDQPVRLTNAQICDYLIGANGISVLPEFVANSRFECSRIGDDEWLVTRRAPIIR